MAETHRPNGFSPSRESNSLCLDNAAGVEGKWMLSKRGSLSNAFKTCIKNR